MTTSSLRPLICHKPELSSIISIEVVHNYLAIISVEKILSGIDIKEIVTSCIWTIKRLFLYDPQFNEIFLVCLFFFIGGSVGEPKIKEKHKPTPLGLIENRFSATSKISENLSFFFKY